MSSTSVVGKAAQLSILPASSSQARPDLITLFQNTSDSYHRKAESQCNAWSFSVPPANPKSLSQILPKDQRDVITVSLSIYTDDQALKAQNAKPQITEMNKAINDRKLSTNGQSDVWYPAAGFIARGAQPTKSGNGVIVMLALFECKEGKRQDVVDVIAKYTQYVEREEQGVLTYCTMTSPTKPNQVLLFERYANGKALAAHGSTKDFKAMFKGIAPNIETKQTKLQQLAEADGSFVGNEPGASSRAAKL